MHSGCARADRRSPSEHWRRREGVLPLGRRTAPAAGGRIGFLARNSPEGTIESLGILVGLELVAVALGIAIGTPIGKKLEQRLQH